MSDDCVEWPSKTRGGYPAIWRNGNWRSVLRMVWDGPPIPPGWRVYQTCGNKLCLHHLDVKNDLRELYGQSWAKGSSVDTSRQTERTEP